MPDVRRGSLGGGMTREPRKFWVALGGGRPSVWFSESDARNNGYEILEVMEIVKEPSIEWKKVRITQSGDVYRVESRNGHCLDETGIASVRPRDHATFTDATEAEAFAVEHGYLVEEFP